MFSDAVKGLFTSVIFLNAAEKQTDMPNYDQLTNTQNAYFASLKQTAQLALQT